MPGIDTYLTSQVQNPRIWHGVRIPENLHFGKGEWTTDVLLVAKPGYRLMSRSDDPKIITVSELPDDLLKGGAGYNPNPEEVAYPKIEKGQKLTEEINETLKAYKEYHDFRYDMHTQAFLMGPGTFKDRDRNFLKSPLKLGILFSDFKVNHIVHEEIEVLDFYQIICFLLNIPAGEHSGSWSRIEDLLTVSAAPHGVAPALFMTLIPLLLAAVL